MNSISFPKMFRANQTMISEGKETTLQNLRLLFLSNRGELFGDPQYGSTITESLYEYNNGPLLTILKDKIQALILNYLPQLHVKKEDISFSIDLDNCYINILGYDDLTSTSDMYSMYISL